VKLSVRFFGHGMVWRGLMLGQQGAWVYTCLPSGYHGAASSTGLRPELYQGPVKANDQLPKAASSHMVKIEGENSAKS